MRNTTSHHLRLTQSEVVALDRIAEERGKTRSRVIRDGIELLLSTDAQTRVIRQTTEDAVEAFRLEAAKSLRLLVEAAAASDATSRQLIETFLDALNPEGASTQSPIPSASGELPARHDV